MPEFQASHFFILKILQCRIFTAFLIGIANLFRNYLEERSFVNYGSSRFFHDRKERKEMQEKTYRFLCRYVFSCISNITLFILQS